MNYPAKLMKCDLSLITKFS